MRSNYPIINVYKKNNIKSGVVTQLLYGDTFEKLKQSGSWIKIKNDSDNYKGYIKNKKYSSNLRNTHKVFVLFSNLYLKPKNSAKIKKKFSFLSKVNITKKINGFCKFNKFWIKENTLKKINHTNKNLFFGIKNFINVKYKWGGKHYSGVDCSGLIQLFFNYNNKFCPRDAKDQIKYFTKKISLENIKKNDLIFWKGHVALVISKNKLLHAYGPLKKVVIMPIKKTINLIYKTANLKVIGIRRP